ncbi:S41 family peptidase [Inquilinus limosus]|uniref:S41 family peptidase n=1 Tax=Inquilinus limosus TaxID=171674 RepID=UPI00041356F7|nr:S41 family peptidase [Inquilinus limosus]
MAKRLMMSLILCSGLFGACGSASANGWQDLAAADVDFIHQQIEANHPGAVDKENPGFRDWLRDGYEQARRELPSVSSIGDYLSVLRGYQAGFRDPHVYIDFSLPETHIQWPGFVVAGRQGRVLVVSVDPGQNLPSVGAELLSCDGIPVTEFLAEHVFRFRGNPAVPASFDRSVPYLFFAAEGSPMTRAVKSCRFSQDGRIDDVAIEWRGTSVAAMNNRLYNANGGVGEPASLTEPADGIYWLRIPSFSANPPQWGALAPLYRTLNQRQHDIAGAKALVMDIRGNRGGNSTLAEVFIYLLFDRGALLEASDTAGRDSYVDWRASPDNLRDAEGWLAPNSQEQTASDAWIQSIIDGMREALDRGEVFFRETLRPVRFNEDPRALPFWQSPIAPASDGPDASRSSQAFVDPVPMRAKLFVLMDGGCGSACLDFLDYLKRFRGVTYLGLPTNADTQYMDARSLDLPSGLGRLAIPMKVYRNRQRPAGGYYTPDIEYDGLQRDNASVRGWALGVVRSRLE